MALVRSEKFGNVEKNKTVDEVTFDRDVSLRPGHLREWRFKLDIGQVGLPSLKTDKSSVRWLVKGVVGTEHEARPAYRAGDYRRHVTV